MTVWSLLRVLAEAVALPLATFAVLTAAGIPALWALIGSAATSVLVVADRYRRTGQVSTLGLIIMARFAAGIAVALATGDATLTLAKDPAFTALVAAGAAATLLAGLPLTARVRRELTGDPSTFDKLWSDHGSYRRLHRRLTVVWTVGLLLESAAGFLIVEALSFTSAVVLTRLLSPLTLVCLSAWTTFRDATNTRRLPSRATTPPSLSPPNVSSAVTSLEKSCD